MQMNYRDWRILRGKRRWRLERWTGFIQIKDWDELQLRRAKHFRKNPTRRYPQQNCFGNWTCLGIRRYRATGPNSCLGNSQRALRELGPLCARGEWWGNCRLHARDWRRVQIIGYPTLCGWDGISRDYKYGWGRRARSATFTCPYSKRLCARQNGPQTKLVLASFPNLPHKRQRISKRTNEMTTQAPETKIVESYRVSCDGGEGALGHPRVWLQIPNEDGWVECPYCDCKLVHKDHQKSA